MTLSGLKSYVELTKPRLSGLVSFTTALGYVLAGGVGGERMWMTLLGTWMMAASAVALNQYWERDLDGLMRRTQHRPLPQRRIPARRALMFALVLAGAGAGLLGAHANGLALALGLSTLLSYIVVYTPLKRRSSLSTLVGAIPGALPPVIGWASARGSLEAPAAVLFAVLFLWQLPHFLAIAWLYRDDYARAGFPVLPVIDADGRLTGRMVILYVTALIPVTLLPALLGLTRHSYSIGAIVLGSIFLAAGVAAARQRTPIHARRLLLVSVVYLPALLSWMAAARVT